MFSYQLLVLAVRDSHVMRDGEKEEQEAAQEEDDGKQ